MAKFILTGKSNMQVFIDAWLERHNPILYIRSCENGQALFCLKGEEIDDLINTHDVDREDLMNCSAQSYLLQNITL